jgi:hypothetical protein
VTVASQLKQLPKAEMLDLDMLLLVATMVRLAQTWALLPLPAECSWTLPITGQLFRSRYWTFQGVTSSVFPIQRPIQIIYFDKMSSKYL